MTLSSLTAISQIANQSQATPGLFNRIFDEISANFQQLNGLPAIACVTAAPYNAQGNGTTNDRAAIQSAYDAVHSAGGGIVLFPSNMTFNMQSTSSTAVVGYSNTLTFAHGATFLSNVTDGRVFGFFGTRGSGYSLASNGSEGDSIVTLGSGNAANFSRGDHVWLYDTTTDTDADFTRERNVVRGVSGDAVIFEYPINHAYATSAAASLFKVTPVENVQWHGGKFLLSSTTGETDAIQMNWGFNCGTYDIAGQSFTGKVVQFWDSLNIQTQRISASTALDTTAGRGYGVQFIYSRHATAEDTYAHACRHSTDVTGGSDIVVRGDRSAYCHTGPFLHGLRAKRVGVYGTAASNCTFGIGAGNGTFDGDFDWTIDGFTIHGCHDAIFIDENSARGRISNGVIQHSTSRAIAINQSTDIDIDNVTIDSTISNPSNFGALDIGSGSDRIKATDVRIRGALHHAVRLTGGGEFTLDGLEIDHAGASNPIRGFSNLTGNVTIKNSRIRSSVPTVDALSLSGALTSCLVENNSFEGVGSTIMASGMKINGGPSEVVIRHNYVKNASEAIRVEDTTAVVPEIVGNRFSNVGNGLRLVAPMTTALLDQNVHSGITGNPIVNSPSANIVGGIFRQGGMSGDRGTGSITLTLGADSETQLFASTLTSRQTITLTNTAAARYPGGRFIILYAASSGSSLAVATLKTISPGQYATVVNTGSAWTILSAGSAV